MSTANSIYAQYSQYSSTRSTTTDINLIFNSDQSILTLNKWLKKKFLYAGTHTLTVAVEPRPATGLLPNRLSFVISTTEDATWVVVGIKLAKGSTKSSGYTWKENTCTGRWSRFQLTCPFLQPGRAMWKGKSKKTCTERTTTH
jgi:hypothetical protein